MAENPKQPREYDAVLGGEVSAAADSAVLGGLEGVKHQLASAVVYQKVAALYQAIKYGTAGLDLVIQALEDKSEQVQQAAENLLLQKRSEPRVKQALQNHKPYLLFECLYTLSGHRPGMCAIAISPDGQTFASCSGAYVIKLWNLHTGELLRTLEESSGSVACSYCSVAFSPDGQKLAATVEDGTIKLWDLHTEELLGKLGEAGDGSDTITCVAFSADGQTLVSGSWKHTINVWNLRTGEVRSNLPGDRGTIMSLAISTSPLLVELLSCGISQQWNG
ncbi:MAG TPA: hypothetical protein V6D14_06600 [Coleofasciculaceae cyanobacterium]|jgi:uncharacterized Zn-finger protein